MNKILLGAIGLALIAGFAIAGPIIGLVDDATGAGIADADARYALAGVSGLTTNDSPTMAAGTAWAFANATVTNTATTGTDIVSYQVMDAFTWVTAPASNTAAGTQGQKAYDDNYFYIAISNNVWRRTTLATW